MSVIALIFDYDDTIVPDSTTQLLEHYNIDPKKFWEREVKKLIRRGYEPVLAVLKTLIDKIGQEKPLGMLNNQKLREIGKEIAKTQYPGLNELIRDLKNTVASKYSDITIEFFVISGGLEEIISSNPFISNNFKGVYGCRLTGDTEDSELKYIKRAVTFTEKTRFLFEINKGIPQEISDKNSSAVNKDIPKGKRKIPFNRMIYVGDGLTDIPCFSLIREHNGAAFGVIPQNMDEAYKFNIYKQVLRTSRVLSTHSPKYNKEDDMGKNIRWEVAEICSKIRKTFEMVY